MRFDLPYTLLITLILTLGCIAPAYSQNKPGDDYTSLIKSAESLYSAKDYSHALENYLKATDIKPGQKQVTDRIEEIRNIIADQEKSQAQSFENDVLEGEKAFKAKNYPAAKKLFENALSIDPTAQYPKDRLSAIREFYTDPADLSQFNEGMSKGNQELTAGNFDKAKNWFQIALSAQPDSRQAREKITETDRAKAEYAAKKLQFDNYIVNADKLLKLEKRDEARASYQMASDIFPNDNTVKAKIQEIDNYQNQKKETQASFDKAVDLGDQFYLKKDFSNARIKYEDALKLKPDARYPKDMIEKSKLGEATTKSFQERYDAAIANADNYFKTGEMESALSGYESALSILPGSDYPQTKITEIHKIQQDRSSRKEAYELALKNGDQAFSEKKFDISLGHYQNALTLSPDEAYPKGKIKEINDLLALEKTRDNNYQGIVAKADNELKNKQYQRSIDFYRQALVIKPDDKYPNDKIAEINSIFDQLKSKDKAYSGKIAKAKQSFEEKRYQESLIAFQDALAIKPGEKYPSEQIVLINQILEKEKAEKAKYDKLLETADNAYAAKNYNLALTNYQDASALKPAEQYPIDKITAINLVMKDNQARQEMYTQAISTGDKLFTEKQYERSLAAYNEAKSIKPDEQYPVQKAREINTLLENSRKLESDYQHLVSAGDSSMQLKNYPLALVSFEAAQRLKQDQSYPKDKINEIKTLLAEQKANEDAYEKAISEADDLFNAKSFEACIPAYQKALNLKPGEKYPGKQINEATSLIAEAKSKQDAYDNSIAEGDKALASKKYDDALKYYQSAHGSKPGESYPDSKIKEINAIFEADKTRNDNYNKAIADGDFFFKANKFREALEPYERASTIKPEEDYPKKQKEKINLQLTAEKKLDDQYNSLITQADKSLNDKNYQQALNVYQNALDLKKDEPYPAEKIKSIQLTLDEIKARDAQYNKALNEGDSHLASKDYKSALNDYNDALKLNPAETYPSEKIKTINEILKAVDSKYNSVIAEADSKLAAHDYSEALTLYNQALEIKPDESYPKDKIAGINETLVKEKAEQDRLYSASIAEGDQYLASQNYVDAKRAFSKASGIKPAEQYPKDKLIEINLVLDARNRAIKDEYDKAIVDADKLYQQKILDQAIEAYDKASSIKPDESYPAEMIRKIRQYITDHSIMEVNNVTITIPSGDEHKFVFSGIEPRLRNNNYVMIRARAIGTAIPKVYFNYGRDNSKNGGIVLRTISNKEGVDYVIRLAGQDKWYREDNNWLSLYTEGCDIEVSKIQISQGE